MAHLTPITPYEMTEDDKKALVKIAAIDYDKRTAVELVELALARRLIFWRITDGISGLLLSKILLSHGTVTFHIDGIATLEKTAEITRPREMLEACYEAAKRCKCDHVSGLVVRKGMLRFLERAGVPIVAHIFATKIPA